MKIQVHFFATFREVFDAKKREVEAKPGATIRELLDLLFDTSERRKEIFDNGELKPYIILLINGRHVQHLNGLETQLKEGDSVALFPPVAGG
jgi:molybdopterin synthase sulfur carrier subunit